MAYLMPAQCQGTENNAILFYAGPAQCLYRFTERIYSNFYFLHCIQLNSSRPGLKVLTLKFDI